MKTKILYILYVTLTLSIAAVWGQSCLNKQESTVNSDMVIDMITPVDELQTQDQGQFWNYMRLTAWVRKAAHIIEYMALGMQMMLILLLKDKNSLKYCICCLYAGLTLALVDETIQIFSSRGPLVSDLWIDLAGTVCGIGVAYLCMLLVKKIKKRKEKDSVQEVLN